MFKFKSFLKKGKEDTTKITKTSALVAGIGVGVMTSAENLSAQETPDKNSIKPDLELATEGEEKPKENNYNFQDYFNQDKTIYNPAEFNDKKIKALEATIKNYQEALSDEEFFSKPNPTRGLMVKEDFKKILKEAEEELQRTLSGRESDIKSYENARQEYDQIMEKLINHVASSEYLEKLAREYNCPIEEAQKIQEARVDAVKAGDYSLTEDFSSFNWRYEENGNIKKNSAKVFLEYDVKNKEEIITHEVLGHKATFAELGLSNKAKTIFKEAYRDNPEFLLNYAKQEKFNLTTPQKTEETFKDLTKYFSDPTEMYARKKNLELELENLGIKKYGEKFTKEHISIAQELKKENKLSQSAADFLEIVKPEYLEIILNELAENNIDNNQMKNDEENKA